MKKHILGYTLITSVIFTNILGVASIWELLPYDIASKLFWTAATIGAGATCVAFAYDVFFNVRK
jgi:hypothetical protein